MMLTRLRLTPNWKTLLTVMVMALTYFGTAQMGLQLASLPGGVTAVWPPTGIALGAVFLGGYQIWPGIFLGALLSALLYLLLLAPPVSLLMAVAIAASIAVANTLEPILGALLINHYIRQGAILNRAENIGKFVVLAGISQLFPALLGVTTLSLSNLTPWDAYGSAWWTWWLAATVSIFIFTPLLLTLGKKPAKVAAQPVRDRRAGLTPTVRLAARSLKGDSKTRVVEVALLLGVVALVSWLTFWNDYPLEYMLLPLLLWSAFRFGQSCVSLLVLLISVIAIIGAAQGLGPFISASPHASLLLLQSFISVVAVTFLTLCALLKERSTAQTRLTQTSVELKHKVEERTAATRESTQMLITAIAEHQHTEEALKKSQQSLDFIALLNRITDKIRESLDQEQILQTAVKELTLGLEANCGNAALYNHEQGTSTVCYEYTTSEFSLKGRVSQMANYPEIYQLLLQGQHCQFCSTAPHPVRGHVVMLAYPISDDQGVLGDLWVVKPKHLTFDAQEVQLVQLVANQCAIALRQARLYQKAQAQVLELERLHRLKDDFLSTVSHELRSPMTNIKMAIQMLAVALRQNGGLNTETSRTAQYFKILQDECQREIRLINDLLDLSRLEAGAAPLTPTPLDLQTWIPQIVEPFLKRAARQQQLLRLDIAAELPPLTVDHAYLERILTELIHNACKYTPVGETITVSAQATPETLQLRVSNSGVEIAASERAHIFEKFYRIAGHDPWKHGGTGLGLALVEKLVNHLGATIQVDSTPEQTIFTLRFPIR